MPKMEKTFDAQESPSEIIDQILAGLDDWRSTALARFRLLIKEADPDVSEDLKWKKPSNPNGVITWLDNGIICTGEIYQNHVKLTFAKGARLDDPDSLFNASLDGNLRRAIDISEGDHINDTSFKILFQAAVALNKTAKKHA